MSVASVPDPARTRVLAEQWGTWVLPHWLERQADPGHVAFAPAGDSGGVANTTMRDRVPVGNLDGGVAATVDPRGLVTPRSGTWSLDWWIGADDRWHLPSREVAVRQSLVADAPVVETTMRVPGGDVVQRVWSFHDPTAGEVVAVELENASRLPVAVALAIRPYGPDGAGRITEFAIDTERITIDGEIAAWLPKPGSRMAASNLVEGDVATAVVSGGAHDVREVSGRCAAGFATAAVVYPLPHTATLRILMPGHAPRAAAQPPTTVPPHDAVARGWASHGAQAARVELPDAELGATLAAARAQLLLAASGRELAGDTITADTAAIVGALDRLGLHAAARAVVATLPSGQGAGGRLGGADPSSDATSAALVTAGRHWQFTRDHALAAALAGPLAAGAHFHTRARPFSRRTPTGSASPGDLGWRLRGILDVADALDGGGQPEAAEALRDLAIATQAALDAALGADGGRHAEDGGGPVPGGASLSSAGGTPIAGAASLRLFELVAPLGVVEPEHLAVTALLEWTRQHLVQDGGIAQLVGATGLSPVLTSLVGRAELRRGERSALDRLDWLVRTGGPSRSWPDLVHPRLGSGCGGLGWSPIAAAAVVDLVLDLVVHEHHDGTALVLCPVVPDSWWGSGIEVHDLPTRFGRISFAVRWHGERPALLWELDPHPGVGSVTLTIPGLDPSWRTTDARGDALLAAPPAPSAPSAPPASSDTAVAGVRPAPRPASDPGPAHSGPAEGDSFA